MGYTEDMLRFGTSGFNDDDWVGAFYPSGMPEREWLTCYAREFDTGEVNSTYYALPKIHELDSVVEKTPVFANNHWRGQAVSTIRKLHMMLD